ncbi:MAG: toll/interleukin-1 receptor domain-containing protein [Acidobacteria bacterium]|nr:toll/interleukin-1 receptor domain-containing protein [Acidobacteriota bacterium]
MKTNHENWVAFDVMGSDAKVERGRAVTAEAENSAPPYWFSGDTTITLGASKKKQDKLVGETVARWDMFVDPSAIHRCQRGFLVIACLRYFGGLHSYRKRARADIWLNEQQIDGFALSIIPPNHTDYFHRPPMPDVPCVSGFRDCQTVYAWPIQKNVLHPDGHQSVKVRIDRDVRWDIDFVALVLQEGDVSHRVFLSHNWEDKPTARALAAKLSERGIGVWLDEAEIRLGDSLIEKIRDAIDTVDYVAVLLSKNSVNSEWVKREVDIAMNQEIARKRVKVLPIRLDDCALPGFLVGKLYADLQSPEQFDRVVAMIEARMRT